MGHRARPLLVAVAFVAFISLGLPDAVLGVAWPSIRQTFSLSLSRLGELLATTMVGYLLSSALSGPVVRRVGVGRLLVGSSALVVLSLVGYWAAPAWGVMVACGLLAGLGGGAVDAGINAYAAGHFLPRQVTWLHACYGVGATLGPFTMTAVLSAGLPWRWGYALIGGVLSLMAILFVITRSQWTLHANAGAGPAPAAATAAQTLRLPLVWVHIALFFIYTGLEVTAGQWLYSLLTGSRQFAPALAGTCVGLYWGGLTAGRVAFGVAAGRFRGRSLLRLSTVAAPAAALLIWWGGAPVLTVAAATLLGFALAPVFPLLISATPDRLGHEVSVHAIGFQVSAACLGGAALPSAAGILAKSRGLEVIGAFLFCVSVGLLALHELALRMSQPRGPAAVLTGSAGGQARR